MLRKHIRSCYASKHFISASEKDGKTMQIFRSASTFGRVFHPAWLCRVWSISLRWSLMSGPFWGTLCSDHPVIETSLMWLMPTWCVLGAGGFTPQGLQDASHPLLLLLPSSCAASLCSWLGHPVPPCDSSGQVNNPASVRHPRFGKSPSRHCSLYVCKAGVAADNGRPVRSSSGLLG